MDPRQELEELRRLDELEARAAKQQPQTMSKPAQALAGGLPMFGGAYAGDLMMGLRQPLDAAAQAAARLTGWGVKDTEAANQRAMDAYKQNWAPDSRIGSRFVEVTVIGRNGNLLR